MKLMVKVPSRDGTSNPLLPIESNFLNLRLVCGAKIKNIQINDKTIESSELELQGNNYIALCSLPIETTEKNITINITPEDVAVYKLVVLKFQAKGSGKAEKIMPVFEEISGNKTLPKVEFLDKLEDGTSPLFKTHADSADLKITLTSYQMDFLCSGVKINDKEEKLNVRKTYFGTFYNIEKSFPVTVDNPIDVKIEFLPKENKTEKLIWTFKLQGGGSNPPLPKSSISIFTINGVGTYFKPLPKDFSDHLVDGTNPQYVYDGKKAEVEIGSYSDETIEKVTFKMDGEKKFEGPLTASSTGYTHVAKYAFEITDKVDHNIQLIVHPKENKYSQLVYTFRLQWSGKNLPMPLVFGIDGSVYK